MAARWPRSVKVLSAAFLIYTFSFWFWSQGNFIKPYEWADVNEVRLKIYLSEFN